MGDPQFWRDIEPQFRSLAQHPFDLRADWDLVTGNSVGDWRIIGSPAALRLRFEKLARQAGAVMCESAEVDSLKTWLDLLMKRGMNFEYGRATVEVNADGTAGAHHLNGTISNLCEASANMCIVLETEAFEAEKRHASDQQLMIEATARLEEIAAAMKAMGYAINPGQPTNATEPGGDNGTNGSGTDQRAAVDAFISKLSDAGRKITRKQIWTVVGYTNATEFERFQRGDNRTTQSAAAAFNRVLNMKPADFIELLGKKSASK